MNWTEISFKVDNSSLDNAAAIANMAVPYGIYIEDYSDIEKEAKEIAHIDLIDEKLLKKDRNTSVIHLYIPENENVKEAVEYLNIMLKNAGIDSFADMKQVDDADWLNGWKKYFKPIEIGKELVVLPSWESESYKNKTARKEVIIDPGAAFGTGTHATTSLCLNLIEKYLEKGDSVLDIGCGSGILSIAASLLGADRCIGIDIDDTAVKTAKENALANMVEAKVNYLSGDLFENIDGKFDLIAANIVADVIIRLLKDVDRYLKENTVIITSGIIDIREKDVKTAFSEYGFTVIEELKKDNWYAFAIKKEINNASV